MTTIYCARCDWTTECGPSDEEAQDLLVAHHNQDHGRPIPQVLTRSVDGTYTSPGPTYPPGSTHDIVDHTGRVLHTITIPDDPPK